MATPCTAFRANPTKNPHTGRSIRIGGSTYNTLVKKCGSPPNINTRTTIVSGKLVQPIMTPKLTVPVQSIITPKLPVIMPKLTVPVQPATIPKPLVPIAITNPSPKLLEPEYQKKIPVISPEETRETTPMTKGLEVINIDSPAETFVNIIIAEQDADIMEAKEYLGYVRYLLNDQSKYDVFSKLFPNNTCPGVIFRMETENSPTPRIIPNERTLIDCIHAKEIQGGSIAVSFTYQNHANILWFDTTNKIINRYDPQISGDIYGQSIMDDTIRKYFENTFPNYIYLGNTLQEWQCVQGVRGEGRTFKSDYYCIDYSLLYAINRINGMSHEDAAFSLVTRGEDILVDLAELLRALAYRVRYEMGKEIPERFREWKPGHTQ